MTPRIQPALHLVHSDTQRLIIRRDIRTDAPLPIAPDAGRIAAWCAAGTLAGLALVWLVDRLTAGPGLGVMLGW